jgi:uncharacterized RDD family membrane protein YckC
MKRKELYTAIAAVIFLILLYGMGSYFYFAFTNSFFFNFSILATYIPSLLGIAGAIIFFSTGFKKSRLIRFYMCLEMARLPFTIWFYISYFTRFDEYSFSKPSISAMFIISMFFTLLMAACCAVGLWFLSKEQKIKLTFIEHGGDRLGQFEPATAGLRFTNRLIDSLTLVYLIFGFFFQNRLGRSMHVSNEYKAYFVLEIPFVIGYYLLLEGIFNTTAGKCATNTIVVNENGERPNFGQILGRTFARLIPFDALSFLGAGARGWHDSLSGTYVVSAANNEEAPEEITLDAELNQQQ